MIAGRYRPSTAPNQSGVSYGASDMHTNLTTFSRPVSSTATSILGYRSRFLPRASSRALPITQLDIVAPGVLGGVSGFRMLHGLYRASATDVRVRSDKLKHGKIIERANNSTHTADNAVSFRVQRTDAHSRRLVPDGKASPVPRAWVGKCWIGSPSAAGWVASSGCDFG